MSIFLKGIGKKVSHFIFRSRKNCNRLIRDLANKTNNKHILEIGSGKKVNDKYVYSYKDYFNITNKFVRSDIISAYGHKVIDITKLNVKNKYDIIICLNVLEHVYDFQKAINNMRNALKKNGELIVFIPYIYPLHDLPHDYFRFSEFALKKLFSEFTKSEIKHFGLKRFPSGYFIKAIK